LDIEGQHGRRFLCAGLIGRRGRHTPFVQAGAETSDTGAEAVEPDPRCSWKGDSKRVSADARDESTESRGALQPLRVPSVIRHSAVLLLPSD